MAIAWVQGTENTASEVPYEAAFLSPNIAGNCLIASIGIYSSDHGQDFSRAQIRDKQGNYWLPVGMTPIIEPYDFNSLQVYTWICTNCKGGANTVSYLYGTTPTPNVYAALTVDEYSGVAAIKAVNQFTFATTKWGVGATEVDSSSIPLLAGEMLYSSAFCNSSSAVFTPSAGFTSRTLAQGNLMTLQTWDQQPVVGSYNNLVSVLGSPDALQVTLLTLSSIPIASPIVQVAWNSGYGFQLGLSSTFTYPNVAGNSLIALYYGEDEGAFGITDTLENDWQILSTSAGQLFAYCLNCKPGSNTVTVTVGSGGESLNDILIIAEYVPLVSYTVMSQNNNELGSINTGNVAVASPPNFLISTCAVQDIQNVIRNAMICNPGIRRFQVSERGYFESIPELAVLADQYVLAPGSYSDTFTVGDAGGANYAAIWGFTISPLTLSCASGVGTIGVPYSSILVASGGIPPYTFSIISGSLPNGLTLNSSTGLISGIPTRPGNYPYTAQVMDSGSPPNVATASCSIFISNFTCFLVDFPINGPFYDATGKVLSNGYLALRLVFDCNCPCADYQITGNNHTTIQLDSNGMVTGSPQIRPNDQLKPNGSYYILQAFSEAGQLVLGPKVLLVTS
jgi:hypothetical protein